MAQLAPGVIVRMEPLSLRIEEAAAAIPMGKSKLWEEIGAGRIKVIRIGRSVRIPTDELRRYIEARKAEQWGAPA